MHVAKSDDKVRTIQDSGDRLLYNSDDGDNSRARKGCPEVSHAGARATAVGRSHARRYQVYVSRI